MRQLVFLFIFLFSCSSVFAISGVSPSSYEIDFEPGLSRELELNFIFDKSVRADLYVDGTLKDYVRLDKDYIVGSEGVKVFLNFPMNVSTPGVNILRIGAKQISEGEGGVGIAADIGGIIKVNVPYPGKYVELELAAPNANAGEFVNISLKAFNRGKVAVDVNPVIQMFNESGKLESLESRKKNILPFEFYNFYFLLDTTDYLPGNYTAIALADYGGDELARDDDLMRLGELRLEIVNYTKRFDDDAISRFEIDVESFWNNPVEDLYAEVYVLDLDWLRFETTKTKVKPWGTAKLVGFLDTEPVATDPFMANVTIYYENTSTSHVFALNLDKKTDFSTLIYVLATLIVLGFIVWRIYVFMKRVKKHKA